MNDTDPPDHVDRVREQWRQVRPELDTSPLAVVARVGRTAAYFDQSTNTLMERYSLSRSSWDVLATLRRAGPPYECSPTELYRGLMRTSGTMTNRLKRLERKRLIERFPDPRDGRGILVRLTPEGLSVVDEVAPLHLANERGLLRSLDPSDLRALETLLRRLLRDLEVSQSAPPRQGLGAHANELGP
jgi:DNA-binding MarR family transcriptional regulator